jgi:hypothetical protein
MNMATEPRNVSGGAGWSRGDIVELVALLVGIPAAIGAVFMLATYYKRRSQGRKGEILFPPRQSTARAAWSVFCITHGIFHRCCVTHVVLRRQGLVMRPPCSQPVSVISKCTVLPATAPSSGERSLPTHECERRREAVVMWGRLG